MVRETYYQDVGNPLQHDLLPLIQPELQFSHKPLPLRQAALVMVKKLPFLVLVVFLALFTNFYSRVVPPGLAAAVLIVVAASLISRAWAKGDPTELPGKFFILALAAACLFLRPSAFRLLLATVMILVVCTVQFGRHWGVLCTASPLPRNVARRYLQGWSIALLLFGAAPLVAVIVGGVSKLPILSVCLMLAVLLVQCSHRRPAASRLNRFQILGQAVVSWLTYNANEARVPGLLRSPAGKCIGRDLLTYLLAFAIAALLARAMDQATAELQVSEVHPATLATTGQSVIQNHSDNPLFKAPLLPYYLHPTATTDFLFGFVLFLLMHLAMLLLLVLLSLMTPILLAWPVLTDASDISDISDVDNNQASDTWTAIVSQLQSSVNPFERQSIYVGRIVADGSPLIITRNIQGNHAHYLGETGSGKTAKGLNPHIEQIMWTGDCSIVLLDLKADSLELLATLYAAAEGARRRSGRNVPVKFFSNQNRLVTHAFNPLMLEFWNDLDLYIKVDILCGALGLIYGTDYGEGYYSSANAMCVYIVVERYPEVRTFKELAEKLEYLLAHASKEEFPPKIREAGIHVLMVFKRLGSLDALNVSSTSGHPQEVLDGALNFATLFERPEIHYLHLSSTLAPGFSPEIARLAAYSLLGAATRARRRHRVYLIIDEFQRMVAKNLEYLLQLARSMGVSVIVANQSMEDLRSGNTDLITPLETNCRFRRWFTVSSAEDRKRLMENGGTTVEEIKSKTTGSTSQGKTVSETRTEQILPRLSLNDILLASDHPDRSIVTITRGDGYAQLGGQAVIVESDYHISQDEYRRRQSMPWPDLQPGTYIPRAYRLAADGKPKPVKTGPIIATEVIGDDEPPTDDSPKGTKRPKH